MRNKIVLAISILTVCVVSVFGAGSTPIQGLKLIGDADGNRSSFTNLVSVTASNFLMTGSSTSSASAVTIGYIGDTTLGSEGIRKIGALGGYTLEEFIEDTATRGLARDLPVFSYNSTNLTVSYSKGDVYEPILGYFHLDPGTHDLTDNAANYAYWSTNDTTLIQWTTGSRPRADGNIYLATFATSLGKIIHVGTGVAVGDELLSGDVAFANIMPSIITEGLVVYPTGTNLTNIVSDAGVEYHNMADRIDHSKVDFSVSNSLAYYGHVGGVWTRIVTNKFPVGLWDNGTNIVSGGVSNWYRGVFVSIAGSGQLTWITPDRSYTNDTEAIAGNDPDLPPGFTPYIPLTTAYVFRGDDTSLRTDSIYWLDRRFMIRRGAITSGGGGGGNTPTLAQVLLAGAGTGGILPSGMGNPVTDDQGASKGYVDSTRNKASTGTAYVDPVNGDDVTGRIEKGSLPFKTIQAAIDACAVVATDARRFLVSVSIGIYNEDVTMKNFIGIRGMDIESTIIRGQVTYPSTYDDVVGGEVTTLSIFTTNKPAVVINQGADNSYGAIRSCAIYSTWDDTTSIKTTIQISRGQFQIYGTTWVHGDYSGNGGVNTTCLYYGTTNSSNLGSYDLLDSSGYHVMNSSDTNDTISIAYSDAAQNSQMAFLSGETSIYLDDSTSHFNKVKLAYQNGASGSIDFKNCTPKIYMNVTNNIVLIAAASENTPSYREGAGVHYNGCRVRALNIKLGNAYHSSSPTIYDYAEAFWTDIAPSTMVYPVRYMVDGSAGKVGYILGHNGGDILLGGGLDMSADNPYAVTPVAGHGRWYAQTTSGFENPYWIDSAGISLRTFRDSVRTLYNAEATPLVKGEVVCMFPGVSGTANYVKRAKADSLATKAYGVVISTSISAGGKGRVSVGGRIEAGVDTSYCVANDALYLSGTVAGGFTNVAPSNPYYVQPIGRANTVGTNGSIHVDCRDPDVLGNQIPSTYATVTGLTSVVNAEMSRATNAESGLSIRINTETNRASVAETNLQARISLATNRIFVVEGKTNDWNNASMNGIDSTNRLTVVEGRTSTWNNASTVSINATNRLTVVEARTSLWNTASTISIDATNRLTTIEARTSTWNTASVNAINATNRLTVIEGRTNIWEIAVTNVASRITATDTSNWNTASTPSRKFLANVGVTANQTFGNATAQVLYTNVVFNYGGTYSNSSTIARWIPGVSNVMVSIHGAMSVNGASQPVLFQIKLYKNGSLKSTMATRYVSSNNDDWAMPYSYVDITTSASDYYEVFVTSDKAGQVMLGSGEDNWWSGQIVY